MTYKTRFAISRPSPILLSLVYALAVPAVQARCFYNDNDDFDDDDFDERCLSTGARVGIAVGVSVFTIILVYFLYAHYQRRRPSVGSGIVVNPAGAPPPLPPPAFFAAAPPIHNGLGQTGLAPQGYIQPQAAVDNGAQYAPPPGPPPTQSLNPFETSSGASSSSELPPAYNGPPVSQDIGGTKAFNQVWNAQPMYIPSASKWQTTIYVSSRNRPLLLSRLSPTLTLTHLLYNNMSFSFSSVDSTCMNVDKSIS